MRAWDAVERQLRAAWARVAGLFTRDRYADDLREEMAFHLEMETEANIRRGMDPVEARRRALLAAGGTVQAAEAVRARRGLPWLDTVAADLRFGIRSLRKNPAFTLTVVATLALGIGANTAIFSVVDGVLLRPLAFAEPDRLVTVTKADGPGSRGEFLEMQRELDVFEAMGLYHLAEPTSLTGEGDPVRLETVAVSAGFFEVLGVPPMLGRDFVESEVRAGEDRVVILSHGLWRDRFGEDPEVVGSTLQLDGETRTVVGVMPPRFRSPAGDPQVWVPVVLEGDYDYYVADMWSYGGYAAVARLGSGVGIERAREAVVGLAPHMQERFPWGGEGLEAYWTDAVVTLLQTRIVGEARPMLLVLLGAVAMVLLVACVNVANLLLARGVARTREMAVRTSLGAGRGRIVRQLLTESLLLAGAGGAAGIVLAFVALPAMGTVLPPDMPRLDEVGIDLRVLGFSLAATVGTGLLFGLGPAWLASGADVRGMLKEGGGGDGGGRRTGVSALLVSGQVALAAVLVISAGLLTRSLWSQLRVDPGFRTENIVSATVAPPDFRYEDDEQMRGFYTDLLEALQRRAEVRSAAVASGLPFGGDAAPYQTIFRIEGRGEGPADYFFTEAIGTVSPGFFGTLDIELVQGRLFVPEDGPEDPPVAVVSRRAAAENWPGEEVIGQRFRFIRETTWRTVVGVVEDVNWGNLREAPGGSIYVPLTQGKTGVMQVVVRSTGDPAPVGADLRAVVADLDGDTPVSDLRTMETRISGSVAGPRSTVMLVGLFAVLALALGAVGIYGVVAYTVGRRTHELGIRRALGAGARELVGLVLGRGMALAGVGIVVGTAAALLVTRVLSSLLFGVSPIDPVTYTVVPLLLAGVALVASWIPARRAMRVQPRDALRSD